MLQNKHSLWMAGLCLALACRQAKDPVADVLKIREQSDLATTEYSITKIVKASDDKTWYKMGDRKILLSVQADIKAGIDLSALTKDDVSINGNSIRLQLPAPKLISVNLPPEKIKVEYEEIGLLRQPFDNAGRDALLTQAETQIRKGIPALGIYAETEKNTRAWLTRFLEQAGYQQVEIVFGNQNPLQ